jgi:hypothetical protein
MKHLRCTTSSAAGIDLGTTIKELRCKTCTASYIGLGTTAKYLVKQN